MSSVAQLLLISIFDRALPLSGGMLVTDLVVMPLFDAVYAFLCFCCPIMLYLHIKKVGWRAVYARLLKACRIPYAEKNTLEP